MYFSYRECVLEGVAESFKLSNNNNNNIRTRPIEGPHFSENVQRLV